MIEPDGWIEIQLIEKLSGEIDDVIHGYKCALLIAIDSIDLLAGDRRMRIFGTNAHRGSCAQDILKVRRNSDCLVSEFGLLIIRTA